MIGLMAWDCSQEHTVIRCVCVCVCVCINDRPHGMGLESGSCVPLYMYIYQKR